MSDRLRFAALLGLLSRHDGPRPSTGIGFRQDIEGLRGICVVAVVLFHAFPARVPGGFAGVDVFFVISGFLISTILYREFTERGRIDLANFWTRRITRILPACTLVLLAIAFLACLIPTFDTRPAGRHIIAAAAFYYNWRQAAQSVDYLAADHGDNPVLHYWSLSVEEQFYLVWPVLLSAVLLWLRRRQTARLHVWLIGLMVALWMVSFAYNVHLTPANGPYAFFGTFTRCWQLLSGALVAMAVVRMPPLRKTLSDGLAVASLLALAAAFIAMPQPVAYPGLVALVPTGAAALLIFLNANQRSLATGVLSTAPLRYAGRISFSWYLWHWPLLVFGKFLLGSEAVWQWAMIGVSFFVAAATYRFVENPVRHSAYLRARPRVTFALGASLIASGVGAGLALKHFGPDDVPIGNGAFVSAEAVRTDNPLIYKDGCLIRLDQVQYPKCEYGAPAGAKTVVLLGDSHAANWFSPLNEAAKRANWRLVVRVKASCRAVDAPQRLESGRDYWECAAWRKAVLGEIGGLKPDLIIVAGMSAGFPADAEQRVFAELSASAPIVVMRDTPTLPETPAGCLRRTQDPSACHWRLDERLWSGVYPVSTAQELPTNARIVDLNRRVCPEGICHAVVGRLVTMFDKHHLTDSYSRTLTDAFAGILAARQAQN